MARIAQPQSAEVLRHDEESAVGQTGQQTRVDTGLHTQGEAIP